MDNYKQLEKTLNHIIKKMNDSRSIFCENSRTDFIRSRKLDFQDTIKILFCMENGSLRDELFKSFDNALDTPTASAFVQARNKIKGMLLNIFSISLMIELMKTYCIKDIVFSLLMGVNCQSIIPYMIKKQEF